MLSPPIEPMLAGLVPELPRPGRPGGDLLIEPTFDGFRVIGFCLADRVYLQSRTGRNLTGYFPDIARVLRRSLPAQVVLDGELVIFDPQRDRTSFAGLRRRLTAGRALRQTTTSTEAIVAGVIGTITNPEAVLLGRYDRHGRLRYVGRSHPLTTVQRRDLVSIVGGYIHLVRVPVASGVGAISDRWAGDAAGGQPGPSGTEKRRTTGVR